MTEKAKLLIFIIVTLIALTIIAIGIEQDKGKEEVKYYDLSKLPQ